MSLPDEHGLWRRQPLQWYHAKRFARVIREGDEIECRANGLGVRASLQWAIDEGGGESWAVVEDGEIVGVYGWTKKGAVWSYWRNLKVYQIKELMRVTASYVLEMVEHAAAAGLDGLSNFVWEGNREALAWLKGSHCFELDLDHRHEIGDKNFIAFKTKPGEELRRYV